MALCCAKKPRQIEQLVHNIDASGPASRFEVEEKRSTKTTIPFIKNNEFDYAVLLKWMGPGYEKWAFLISFLS
jgi:phospho-N-acetylmuramoyl-pentapeptide-transferase